MSKKCRILVYCVLFKFALKEDLLTRQGTSIENNNAAKYMQGYGILSPAKLNKHAAGQDSFDYWYSSDDGLLPENIFPIARALNTTLHRRLAFFKPDADHVLKFDFFCINRICMEQCIYDNGVLGYCKGYLCVCVSPSIVEKNK